MKWEENWNKMPTGFFLLGFYEKNNGYWFDYTNTGSKDTKKYFSNRPKIWKLDRLEYDREKPFIRNNIEFINRNIVEENTSAEELALWMEKSGLEPRKCFNTSGVLYREMNLKDKIKTMSKEEMIEILSTNGMLVKRPLLVMDDKVLVGFKEENYKEII